jgi:uncharacterized membrane protein YjdF
MGGIILGAIVEVLNVKLSSEKSLLKKIIFLLELGIYLLSFISFVYFIFSGMKGKAIQSVVMFSLVFGFRFIQFIGDIKLYDQLKLFVLIFIFMAIFLAEILNFYSRIPIFDKILHSSSGVMLFFVGQALYEHIHNLSKNPMDTTVMILFSMFFAIAMAGSWEIFEFSMDRLMGYHLQNDSLFDTMGDIICGTSTATITALISSILLRVKKANMHKNQVLEEIQSGVSDKVS